MVMIMNYDNSSTGNLLVVNDDEKNVDDNDYIDVDGDIDEGDNDDWGR